GRHRRGGRGAADAPGPEPARVRGHRGGRGEPPAGDRGGAQGGAAGAGRAGGGARLVGPVVFPLFGPVVVGQAAVWWVFHGRVGPAGAAPSERAGRPAVPPTPRTRAVPSAGPGRRGHRRGGAPVAGQAACSP